jgi:hypothetical protein
MKDFNLDDFKQTWQSQNEKKVWADQALLKLIQSQSRHQVGFILYLSLAEILLFFVLPYLLLGNEHWEQQFLTPHYQQWFHGIEWLFNGLNIGTNLYFIVLFVRTYQSLKIDVQIKNFNQLLLKFRQNAKRYVWFNLGYTFVFSVLICIGLYFGLDRQQMHGSPILFIGILALILGLLMGLQYAYFRWVYGYFFDKINQNLSQITQMEAQTEC